MLSTIVTDPALVLTEPNVPRPAYKVPMVSAPSLIGAVPVTRIGNDTGASTSPVSGSWGSKARHVYAKQQPWNADESLIVIENQNSGASPAKLLLDGSTYLPVSGFCGNYPYYDFRWHPSLAHKNEQINVNSAGTELMWFNMLTCTKTRSWTLPIVAAYGIGSGEGNPSNDGRFVAINSATQVLVVDMDPQPPLQTYDQGNRRIGPPLTVSNCGLADCVIDWVSVSSSGKYVVVHYEGDNNQVFDVNPSTLALTPRAMPATSCRCLSTNTSCTAGSAAAGFIFAQGHADMAANPFDNDEDVLVGQGECHTTGNTITALKTDGTVGSVTVGRVMLTRLRDGAILPLTDPTNEAFAHHISTRNINRPGWAYVSYFQEDGKRFSDEAIAVKMDGSKAVERFAWKHSVFSGDQCVGCGCYCCESHVVPSMDGRRMIFASNWAEHCGTGCSPLPATGGQDCSSTVDTKDYVIDARCP